MADEMAWREKAVAWITDPTFEEKSIFASMFATTLICGFYLLRLFQLYRDGSPEPAMVYRLWITIIIASIFMTIFGSIFMNILFSIIYKIRTNENDTYVRDERDKLIQLKGSRVSYLVLTLGVFLSMLTMALGKPPLVMFNGLIVAALVADFMGDLFRLILYRRGF